MHYNLQLYLCKTVNSLELVHRRCTQYHALVVSCVVIVSWLRVLRLAVSIVHFVAVAHRRQLTKKYVVSVSVTNYSHRIHASGCQRALDAAQCVVHVHGRRLAAVVAKGHRDGETNVSAQAAIVPHSCVRAHPLPSLCLPMFAAFVVAASRTCCGTSCRTCCGTSCRACCGTSCRACCGTSRCRVRRLELVHVVRLLANRVRRRCLKPLVPTSRPVPCDTA